MSAGSKAMPSSSLSADVAKFLDAERTYVDLLRQREQARNQPDGMARFRQPLHDARNAVGDAGPAVRRDLGIPCQEVAGIRVAHERSRPHDPAKEGRERRLDAHLPLGDRHTSTVCEEPGYVYSVVPCSACLARKTFRWSISRRTYQRRIGSASDPSGPNGASNDTRSTTADPSFMALKECSCR